MIAAVFKKRGSNGNTRKRMEDDSDHYVVIENPGSRFSDASVLGELKVSTLSVRFESSKDAGPAPNAGSESHTDDSGANGLMNASVCTSKVSGSQGPLRAPVFLRTTTRFDYQPDVCKDFKETGFCGYGDSCKFLHDRGDYKSGWQQEKEWDEQQGKKKKKLEQVGLALSGVVSELFERAQDGSESGENGEQTGGYDILPHSCMLCLGDFKNPVVTMCGHYFCSSCILEANQKNSKCPATNCARQMNGVFNKAVKLIGKKVETAQSHTATKLSKSERGRIYEVLNNLN
jgi:RING finger protein 113A